MERPLWQIVIALLLLGVAAHRGAVAAALAGQDALTTGLLWVHVVQAAAAVVAALGVWRGGRMALVGVLFFGATVTAAVLAALAAGVLSAFAATSQILVVLLATGALFLVLRYEFGPRGSGVRSGG